MGAMLVAQPPAAGSSPAELRLPPDAAMVHRGRRTDKNERWSGGGQGCPDPALVLMWEVTRLEGES